MAAFLAPRLYGTDDQFHVEPVPLQGSQHMSCGGGRIAESCWLWLNVRAWHVSLTSTTNGTVHGTATGLFKLTYIHLLRGCIPA